MDAIFLEGFSTHSRSPISSLVLPGLLAFGLLAASGCAAEPTEEQAASDATPDTMPACSPAGKGSAGQFAASKESDAVLDQFIAECPFDSSAVTADWTEDFGRVWWNHSQPGTTAAVGVELSSGEVVCT